MDPALGTQLAALGASYDVDIMYVFGSRAAETGARVRGEDGPAALPTSDIDIGVQPARGTKLTAQQRVRLTIELEDLLGASRVDLVILPEADPFLAAEVVRGELLYARDLDQEAETQLYYLRRAGDLAPFFRQEWDRVVGRQT